VGDTLDTIPTDSSLTGDSSKSLANDIGTSLSISSVSPTSAGGGSVTLSADHSQFTYTPADDFSGVDTFAYTVTDPTGGTSTATETVTVTPIAKNDAVAAIALNTPVTIQPDALTGNDRGSNLTITGVSNATRGSAVLNADQSVTFTPTTGKAGTASFQYTVSDGTSQSTATVIVPVNPAAGDYTETVNSGDTLSVTADDGVLSKDADRAGETASDASTPHHGTVTLNSDGSFTYVPATTYSGPDSFTYTVTDDSSGSPTTSTGKVTITVKPQAQADDLGQMDAGASKTLQATDLTGNDHGAHLSIVSVGTIAAGTAVGGDAVLNGDGTVTFTPAADFSGPASFQYTITDGSFPSTATATVLVKPVAVDDTLASTTSDAPITFDASALLGNDSGYRLALTGVGDPALGDVTLSADGKSFTYTPQAGFSGTYRFSYTAEDGSSLHQPVGAIATITVKPTAGSLQITAPSGVADSVDAAHGLLSKSSGADGTGLAVALDPNVAPAGGTVVLGDDGAFVYTPDATFSGTDTFGYVVTDGSGQKSTGIVTVTVLPKANADTVAASAARTTSIASAALLTNDAGSGLHVTGVTQPADGTLVDNGDGTYTYTPSGTFSGSDSFTYTVTDAHGTPSTATVTLTVPVAATDDAGSVLAGQTLAVDKAHGVLSNDHGSTLRATVLSQPSHGDLTLNADGSYTYTPDAGYSGPDSFTYTATDVHGDTDTATVKLSVLPAAKSTATTDPAGSPLHLDAPGVLAGALGDRPTVTTVDGTGTPGTPVTTPAGNTVTIASDGTVDFTPAPGYSGTDTITYQVTDHSGLSSTGTIVIAVTPRALGDSFSTPAGTPLPISTLQLTRNDLGTGLQITGVDPALSGTTATLAHGTLVKQPDGSYIYTPNAGFSGTDTFDYTVTDSSHQTATATATIVVGDRAADYAETAASGSATTVAASPTTGLLSHSSGSDLTIAVGRNVAHGTLVVNRDGSYTYTPNRTFSGVDSFTYSVTDPSGQVSTGIVTFTVAPLAVADSATIPSGSTLTRDVKHGVLSNDNGTLLRVTATGTPTAVGTTTATGLVTISGSGALVYTPPAGFSGSVTIPYTVEDENSQSADAVVTIHVTPVAADDAQQTIAGHRLRVGASKGLLADDSGSSLVAALKTAPRHGTVTVSPDGSYTYTPAKGFAGTDTFTYTATDSSGQVTTAVATITVLKAAAATNDHATGTPGKPVQLAPLGNDHPTAGANFDPSTVQLIDPATGAASSTVRIPGKGVFTVADGDVTFTPLAHFAGTATIDYQVSDSDDVLVRALITVVYPSAAAAAAPAAGPGDPTAAPVAGGSGTAPGALAFTGSQGVGGMVLIGLGGLLMGLVLVLMRRFRRPAPGPRRTGM
jgi:CshA-type fibril repeat protein